MIIRPTTQGFEVSAIIDGYLVTEQFIGYSRGEARRIFNAMYGRKW